METIIPLCAAGVLVALLVYRWFFGMTDMTLGMTAITVQVAALAVLVIPAMVA